MSDEYQEAWRRHPRTRALKKELKEQLRRTHEALLNRAKQSTDPLVAAAFARWENTKSLLEHFEEPAEEG